MNHHFFPPYDFELSAEALRHYSVCWKSIPTPEGSLLRRVIRVGDVLVLVQVRSMGELEAPKLEVEVLHQTGDFDRQTYEKKIRWLLHPHVDPRPFYAVAKSVPALAETTRQLYGLRTFGLDTLFESLVTTMIEQQITLKMAQQSERWLIEQFGDALIYEGEPYYTFPAPSKLASVDAEVFAPLKITFVRIRRILALAQGITDGTLPLESWRELPTQNLYENLLALNGVGHWTACWTMLRAVGEFRNFGAADVALRAALNWYAHGQTGRIARESVDPFFEVLGEYAGLGAYYLLTRWALDRY